MEAVISNISNIVLCNQHYCSIIRGHPLHMRTSVHTCTCICLCPYISVITINLRVYQTGTTEYRRDVTLA